MCVPMESVIRYLEAIEGINEVDRALFKLKSAAKRGRRPDPERLTAILAHAVAAYEAANAAWQAVDPQIRVKLYPPPVRLNGGLPPSLLVPQSVV